MHWQIKWLLSMVFMLMALPSFAALPFSNSTILRNLNLSDMMITVGNGDQYQLDTALVSYLYDLKRDNALTLKPGMAVQVKGEYRSSLGASLKGIVHHITPLDPALTDTDLTQQ